jgi:HEAT repeat protein
MAGYRGDDESGAFIIEHLASPVARQRVLALRAATRRAITGEEQWRRALNDPEVDVRREALTLIAAATIDDSLLSVVSDRLLDDDALVVDGAIFAVGEHLYAPAVDALVTIATTHEDARCRESAIAALGALGDDRARPAIMAALQDKPAVRRRAIVALANFEGPDIDAALERASGDRDWQVRAAVDQLGRDAD